MPCSHHKGEQQPNIIDLSQLEYSKSKCPVEEGICRLCQDISGVEKDIADAIARVKDLLSRHQQLKAEINSTHSPIIRDLPVDVLSKIFYACFSDDVQNDHWKTQRKDVVVPLKIAGICRTWRQVAWSTPELWTVIVISRRFSSCGFSRSSALSPSWACDQYDMIREWVTRSGILPLHVSIYENLGDDDNIDVNKYVSARQRAGCSCWESTLKVLGECSYRWKDVCMNMSRYSFEVIASSVELKPPSRSLSLSHDCGLETWPYRWPDALQLWKEPGFGPQRVITDAPVRFGHFSIGWQHVSHVDVEGWSIVDCLDLLKITPRLLSCAFADVRESQPGLGEPVTCHESLRELSLYCKNSPGEFFDHVALPSLDNFTYPDRYSRDSPVKVDDPSLMSFFTRSSFPLTKLSVVAHMFTPGYMVTILNTVPLLTHLNVYCSGDSATMTRIVMTFFLDHLASTSATSTIAEGGSRDRFSQAGSFLPRLEALELLGSWEFNFLWSSVANIFGSPSEVGAEGQRPLRSLGLHTWTPNPVKGLSDEMVARFLSLKEAGIAINYILRSYSHETVPVSWEGAQ
ncbi:hypothetical protein CPC08DRAFT_713206 [Agrocybe pediades]|nr:hypothetical protein CPC08DRAFT_713206 [Agrocybe pediades]